MKSARRLGAGLVAAGLLCCGCLGGSGGSFPAVPEAIAVIHPTEGNTVRGWVKFFQLDEGVKVVAEISGLNPNQRHGFHIHRFGNCSSPDGKSAGGHYDPAGTKHHAEPHSMDIHHAGDLGNLQADGEGKVKYEQALEAISISGAKSPILGRAVIIHAKEDVFEQPTGKAGARIGCGVIGVAK